MDLNLDGNAAIVTASSSGLGKASAKALAAEGANVLINGRDEDRLESAAEELRSEATGEVHTHAGDITDPETTEVLVQKTLEKFGGIDHIVTSAGGPTPMQPLEPSDETWHDTFDLLVMSVVRLVRESADHLRADGGGSVINIASMAAKEPSSGNVLSGAVRPSVVGFEKTLAEDLAPEVRVNVLLPGAHDTPRIRETGDAAVERGEYDSYEEVMDDRTEQIPLGKVGDPDAFGEAAAFLCSERASFVTGVAVPIDGGRGSTAF
jgi:NAD(P)-dependent dehydrogenase (short-subunit alcohol dehydrogenase family)